jgi:hypothetical protein
MHLVDTNNPDENLIPTNDEDDGTILHTQSPNVPKLQVPNFTTAFHDSTPSEDVDIEINPAPLPPCTTYQTTADHLASPTPLSDNRSPSSPSLDDSRDIFTTPHDGRTPKTSSFGTLDALENLVESPSLSSHDHNIPLIQQQPDHTYQQPDSTAPNNAPESEDVPICLPSLLVICQANINVFRHVPKTTRDLFADTVSTTYSKILDNPNSVYAWTLVFMLPRCILFSPKRGGKQHWNERQREIRRRIRLWNEGKYLDLWNEALASQTAQGRGRRKKNPQNEAASQEAVNIRRSLRCVQDGQYSKATKALTSLGIARTTPDVLQALRDLHPHQDAPTCSSTQEPSVTPVVLTPDQALHALRSFGEGTAPGPSLMSAAFFKNAVFANSPHKGERALKVLTGVLNLMAAGRFPSAVQPFLCGARLIAANKKQTGSYRPIAVGEVLRRWLCKALSNVVTPIITPYLNPLQVAVGTKGGAEAIIHALAAIYGDERPINSKWILQIDFRNAFNTIDRSVLLEEVRKRLPTLFPWIEKCYGAGSHLFTETAILASLAGLHQGDPLAMLLFSMVLQPLVLQIRRDIPELLANCWFADDGTLAGPRDDLIKAFKFLLKEGPLRGLHVSTTKCVVWCGSEDPLNEDPLDCGVPRANEGGVVVLGSPVGSPAFCNDVLEDRIQKIKNAIEKLPLLENPQAQFVLLRSCLSFPKFAYNLRTCDPRHSRAHFNLFDEAQRRSLESILSSPLTPEHWYQAALPVSLGGMGLRLAEAHSPAAFCSSISQTASLVNLMLGEQSCRRPVFDALQMLRDLTGDMSWTQASLMEPLQQRTLSHKIDEVTHQVLITKAHSERDLARLKSVALQHSGDWLNVIPSKALGLSLHPKEFCVSACYRLGIPIFDSDGTCPECNLCSDQHGDHAVSCGSDGDRKGRHDRLRDAIFATAQAASLAPKKEAPSLIPGSLARPADVYIPMWRGFKTAFDVTVINPLQQAHKHHAAITAGYALGVARDRKMNLYAQDCRNNDITFVPLPVETFGGWDDTAVDHLREMARMMSGRNHTQNSVAIRHFFQRLSITLQRGNANLLLSRRPPQMHPSVTGLN